MSCSPSEEAELLRLLEQERQEQDFPYFAKQCLRIRTKAGAIEPLALNRAQAYIHEQIEDQRARTGKVRKIVLKGRQQGCSTLIEGRFYWRVTRRKGVRAFILTHEQEATNNLFDMAVRYHENCPVEVRPVTGAANAKELLFSDLDSGYKVGTAGTKGVGRSSTIQYFHGSEVAFWPFAQEHAAGVMQAIPDAPDTEIILESTANGLGNWFHEQWQKAVAGEGAFEPIFVPWYWQPEYQSEPPADFNVAPDESEIIGAYGLTPAQLTWRRKKIVELGSLEMFRQEYPNTADEAFQTSVEHAIVPIELIKAAVARKVQQSGNRVIWGLDVARSLTGDRTALAKRWGNHMLEPVKWWRIPDTMQIAGTIFREYLDAEVKPDSICVDSIGFGAGVADRLREMLPRHVSVVDVNVAESPSVDDGHYMRLRDELWFEARQWFASKRVQMPEDMALSAELSGVKFKYTSAGKVQVESKDDMKKRGMKSPDLADSFIMTFAVPDTTVRDSFITPQTHYDS